MKRKSLGKNHPKKKARRARNFAKNRPEFDAVLAGLGNVLNGYK